MHGHTNITSEPYLAYQHHMYRYVTTKGQQTVGENSVFFRETFTDGED